MSQEEYRSCMSGKMKSGRLKGLDKESRRIEFCSIAKECSKGMSPEEARRVCSQPKVPKPEGERKRRRSKKSECPAFDATTLIPHCERKLTGMVRSGELAVDTDVEGICQLILG